MAQRKVQFVNGEIYHIVMRALDSLDLFRDKKDFLRMIHDLFEFNDVNPARPGIRVALCRKGGVNVTKQGLVTFPVKDGREVLVEILAFCLMPNHVHLLVRQVKDGGITSFMQKFGGYALYYNKRHGRKGHLFEDKFQAIHIKNDEQLKTVFVYIHTNPVAIIFSGWKEKGIKDLNKAIQFVENYRWSSYSDYLGVKNFPSVTEREFMLEVMGGSEGCRKFVNAWLRYKRGLADFDYVAIE